MIYKHGKHQIELFASIDNLPILRYNRFIKYQMQASEIGSNFVDFDRRSLKLIQFLQKNMIKEAAQEVENRRLTIHNSYNDIIPSGKAFACLVRRIDNVEYKEYSPENLDACLDHLERIGLGNADAMEQLKEVKKKIENQLTAYFPKIFPRGGNRQLTALRVKRCFAQLDGLIEKKDNKDAIFGIEKEILEQDKPNNWNIWQDGNMERALEIEFKKFAIAVAEQTKQVLETITVAMFYTTVELLKEQKT